MKILSALSGISLPVRVLCGNMEFQGEMLFTHHGLSGPAILQASSYWMQRDVLRLIYCCLRRLEIFGPGTQAE